MSSNGPDEPCNSETEPETIALRIKQKRSRRVSFADTEITSVHIFNRDEEYDTPPDPKPRPSSQNDVAQAENPVIGFFRDLGGDSDDFRDSDDDDQNDDGRKSFFRPNGSPSPGSSVPGSATSNDEDNFFGPVSANFIRPGRLSDSAASDDIHEATLDTTAFSMHYRSLARSDSGGDLKTPTAVRLAFEERMPIHNTNVTDSGSLMSLTKPKMLTPQSSVPADKVRSGEDSNDMSIIEENPHKYEYGRLSPSLDALLAAGSKDLHADSVAVPASSMSPKGDEVSASDENEIGHMRNGRTTEMGNFGTNDMPNEAESVSRIKLSEANGGSFHQTAYDASSNRGRNPAAGDFIDGQIQTPNQLNNVNKEFTEVGSPRDMKKLELTAVNGKVLPEFNSEALQFNVFVQHEPVYQHSSQGMVQEYSLKEKTYNRDQHLDQQYRSPMEGSTLLLSARHQQSVWNTPNLARHSRIVTPSSKQPGSFLSAEHTKHNEWVSSIQKSISRFTLPEPSPCASSLKDGIEKLKCRLSSYSSVNSPIKNVMADISKDLQCKFSNSPTACLEKQTAMPDLNSGQKSLCNTNSNGNENPINISMLSQVNETTDLDKDEEPQHSMVTDTPLKDTFGTPRKAVASPSQLSISGSKMTQHLLMLEIPTEGLLVSAGTAPILAGEREDNPPHLQIESEKNFQSPSRGAVILNCPDKSIPGGAEPLHSKPYVCSSTTEQYLQSPSSKESAENPSTKGRTQGPPRENPILNSTGRKVTQSPLKKVPSQSPHRKESTPSPPRKELTLSPGREPIRSPFVKELTRSPIVRDPIQSPIVREPIRSPFIKDMNSSPSRKESTDSPSRLDSSYAADTENMQPFAGKGLVSHESNSNSHPSSDDCYQGVYNSHSPFTGQDSEKSVGRKRRNLGIISEDGYCKDMIPSIQKSPKVPRSENCNPEFMLHQSNKGYDGRVKCGGDTTWKCWTDILVKFSGDTEQLLSPLARKLNLRAIGVLDDMLVHLLKAKKYGTLCSEKFDCINVGHKRVAEARLLLYKIVYEKAKLQLMQVKRDKLQSRVQLLRSAIQKSQMLKLNYIRCQSEPSEWQTHVDDSHHQSSLVNSEGEQEASDDNVSTMRQELKALDRDVKKLSNFFHIHCKLKGEPSCADAISLVQHQLKTRACCRIICHDLQLWNIDHFEIKNGHYNILLSYHGYVLQRFMGTVGPTSNIAISHNMNDIKITKEFPNMDVQVAFGFVLNAEVTKKSSELRCSPLAQETQVTRSLLRNLLDVVEEVHLARFEIVNLIQTNFQTSSAEQLDLKLCFLNFKSGRQVALTLDVTCLKSGIYPSEILPHQIQASESAVEKPLPESLLAEIRAAADCLDSGYTRIMRLCKCISNVV
ncbi:uncharacterized protein LOC103951819 isoform X2 [Pyrus x bretschneideri]|uniref:uncharacterized protein LOC103951819 isoform X2 n=1 Tax=Pyrus x bretschneideri TaxID=225117 RepID=UPI00202FA423|nr:uncharacterized protein LOC103951819 isoform X2 [Pyrus x bretschneideri]